MKTAHTIVNRCRISEIGNKSLVNDALKIVQKCRQFGLIEQVLLVFSVEKREENH